MIDTTPLITHRFPLSEIEEAYRIFEHKEDGVIKVALQGDSTEKGDSALKGESSVKGETAEKAESAEKGENVVKGDSAEKGESVVKEGEVCR